MTTKNMPSKQIPSESLVQLIALTHKVLQTNKNLVYDFNANEDLYTVYENKLPIVSYGGTWNHRQKYWPDIIRIYPTLGQQIHSDLNCEIRLDRSSLFGQIKPNSFSLAYYPDQGVAYGAIPESECTKIRSEIFSMLNTHKRVAVR